MRRSVQTWAAVASFVFFSVGLTSAANPPPESFKVRFFSRLFFSLWPTCSKVEFETTVKAASGSSFVLEVKREYAPLGADRLYELVQDSFFDDAGFFRVVPKFVVQFGLAADPAKTAKWKKPIQDDPKHAGIGNSRGTVSFATSGKNTRTGQLFVNLGDNAFLDGMGFTPVGRVVSGMDVVDAINAQYGERPSQGDITVRGSAYLRDRFPKLDFIKTARIIEKD